MTQGQLRLPGEREPDLDWMRRQVTELGLKDVTDRHLAKFYEWAAEDKQVAVDAIASIYAGQPYATDGRAG